MRTADGSSKALDMLRVLFQPADRPRSPGSWAMIVGLVALLVPGPAMGQGDAEGQKRNRSSLLLLVSQQVEQAPSGDSKTRYWWSNPTEPQWTQTDRSLMEALGTAGVSTLQPAGDVRISRIYRTPNLSTDNATALASLMEARKAVLGRVTYRLRPSRTVVGLEAIEVRAELQLVDVASAEP